MKVAQQRLLGLGVVGVFDLRFAIYALSNGVPAVLDVAGGPHCYGRHAASETVQDESVTLPRRVCDRVHKNQFIMTLRMARPHADR